MPHETEILFNEPGIQYQGVNDESGGTGAYPVQGLIVGQFKRGRLDKPMIIHRDNIKAMLGHDPKNPYYSAVQDVLNTGVPSIQVLRIGGGAADHAYLTYGYFRDAEIKINGQSFVFRDYGDDVAWFQALFEAGVGIYSTFDSLGCFYLYRFQNMTDQILNISISNAQDYNWGIVILEPQENKTINGSRRASDRYLEEGVNQVRFTLSPDVTFLPFRPDQVAFFENQYMGLYKRNQANQAYQYEFLVNDQPLMNPQTGSNLFNLLTTADLSEIGSAFFDLDIQFARSTHPNSNYVECNIYSMSNQPKKIKIRQLGANDQNTRMHFPTINIVSANEIFCEGYSYDPLDLEQN